MLAPARRLFTARATPQICSRCTAASSRRAYSQRSTISTLKAYQTTSSPSPSPSIPRSRYVCPPRRTFTATARPLASSPTASEAMERIEELFENATEEFQIAAEETEGNTVYASDDRDAARAEVEKLEEFYKEVVDGTGYEQSVREEVRRRAGGRIRELVNAMTALEEKAMEHD